MGTVTNMIYAEYVVDERARPGHRYGDYMKRNGIEEEWLSRRVEGVRPYVDAAMMKAGGVLVGDGDDEDSDKFISCLHSELIRFNADNPSYNVPISTILSATHDLIAENRSHTSIPTHMVREQIGLLGQYAILSHCWEDPDEEELCFADFNDEPHIAATSKIDIFTKIASKVSKVSDKSCPPSRIPAAEKKGFKKLEGFWKVVESRWGCRYLWMDSICISDAEREESIHRMFGWYRRADFKMFANERVYGYYSRSRNYSIGDLQYVPPAALPDPSISFDANNVMRIMLSLHPWPTNTTPTSASTSVSSLTLTSEPEHKHDGIVFASLGTHAFTKDHYGVLLRTVDLSGEDVQEEALPSDASNSRGGKRKNGDVLALLVAIASGLQIEPLENAHSQGDVKITWTNEGDDS
ncbi:hypothetical protein EYR36_001888 [Pleurotus pulmonarius]|nr:hypothetical protein EYR36_001888 [Pleurotus pulmonarius]